MQVNQKNSDTNLDQKLQLEKTHGEHGGMIQMEEEEEEREEGNTQTNNRLPIYHIHHQKTLELLQKQKNVGRGGRGGARTTDTRES